MIDKEQMSVGVAMLVVALLSVCGLRSGSDYVSYRSDRMDRRVAELSTFNDLASFRRSPRNPKCFIHECDPNRPEAYARFKLPAFDPSMCVLTFRIKADPEVLRHARLRTARGWEDRKVISGNVAEFTVGFDDPVPFVWDDGAFYVGVSFGVREISRGAVVELLDFKFKPIG